MGNVKSFSSILSGGGLSRSTSHLALFVPSEPGLMKFRDFYAMGLPIAAPSWFLLNKWMLLFAGQIQTGRGPPVGRLKRFRTGPGDDDFSEFGKAPEVNLNFFDTLYESNAESFGEAERSPFFAANRDSIFKLFYWNQIAEVERWPHVIRFSHLADLLKFTESSGRDHLWAISKKMRSFYFGRVVANTIGLYRNIFFGLVDEQTEERTNRTLGRGHRTDFADQSILHDPVGRSRIVLPNDNCKQIATRQNYSEFVRMDWGRCALLRARQILG